MNITQKNFVTETPPAAPQAVIENYERRQSLASDCWDVHHAMAHDGPGFVLLDVRSKELFDAGHVPGATWLPRRDMNRERMDEWPEGTLFVVYCAGPHCNGSTRAAARLARLGRPVKEMIGGAIGWVDEGFSLVKN